MSEFDNPWTKPLWKRNAEDNMSLRHEIEKNYDAFANPPKASADFGTSIQAPFQPKRSNNNISSSAISGFENPWKEEAFQQKGTNQWNNLTPQSETSLFSTYTQNSNPQAFAKMAKEDDFYKNSKKTLQTAIDNVSPYIPTYYIGSAVANVQNKLPKIKKVLSDAYNSYKDDGLYEVGKKYAEPSVQRALEAKEAIAKLPISDVNKHQYLSCIGATDGLLASAETLGGGLYKEIQDTKDKITNPTKRQSYGGVFGVLQDAGKDLSNDVKGAWKGLWSDNLDECEELLPKPYRNKKYW